MKLSVNHGLCLDNTFQFLCNQISFLKCCNFFTSYLMMIQLIVPGCYPSENQKLIKEVLKYTLVFCIFNLHLLRLQFPWKDVAHCESCTNYSSHRIQGFTVHTSHVLQQQFQAIVFISFSAAPEEAGSGTWNYLTERQQKHHDRTVTEMQQELDCIGRVRQDFLIQSLRAIFYGQGPIFK